jgi:hypothetical protein
MQGSSDGAEDGQPHNGRRRMGVSSGRKCLHGGQEKSRLSSRAAFRGET